MQYPFEDECIDIQRMPGQIRPTHTPENPICFDPTCTCHRDDQLQNKFANEVYDFMLDGLLTVQEADLLLTGRTV